MLLNLPPLMDLNRYISIERANRFMAAKAKDEETDLVAWEAKAQIKTKLDKITKITFIWKHKNRMKDMDNVEFAQKFIWDGLVKAGVIPNDNWNYRPTRTLHKHEVDKDNPGVVVLIK